MVEKGGCGGRNLTVYWAGAGGLIKRERWKCCCREPSNVSITRGRGQWGPLT